MLTENQLQEDNIISLILMGVNEETGDTYGISINDASPDGMYASFVYDDINWVKHDLKHFYRCIPEGEGEWERTPRQELSLSFLRME